MTSTSEVEQEREPQHPGWQPLASVLNTTTPFFEKFLFLRGYGNFASNIYLIMGDYLTIVDAGNDYTAFMDLFRLKLKPEDIKKIVITHGHPDHAMGAFELLRSYPIIRESGGLELILHEAAPSQLKEGVKEFGSRVTEVRGGETLELSGIEWEVIHTPGHTIDGICLYHPLTKTVFTGDMALPYAVGAPDKYAGGSLEHYLFGLKALLKWEIENVLPGHGLPVAPGGRKIVEETYECVMMKIIGVEPQTTTWMAGATALAQRGLLEEAVFCCDKEMARNPEHVRALKLKALCLNDLGQSHQALEILDKLGQLSSSDDSFIFIGKGYALLGLGKYHESINCFDEALRIKPGMKDALVYKGMALYLAGNHEAAMDIEQFRTEFVGRFKEELLKKKQPSHE
ncbi:MAG: MBL fold metallo-hydrolase [candidate division NC10 bacterium]|nr:MBL fold metallo-hydrolase [candidate division NC10 bacterium]